MAIALCMKLKVFEIYYSYFQELTSDKMLAFLLYVFHIA